MKDRDYKRTNLFITGFPKAYDEAKVEEFIQTQLVTIGPIANKIINKKEETLSACVNFEKEEAA